MTDRIDTDAIVALKRIADQKWNDEVTVSRDDLAALLADHARLSDEGLAEMVRQMSLHSLGCSGSVGTDGVECEWPDEGPCLVASLRAEVDRLRALADPAPVGLSQAGYTDEAIGPNEARMIAMNERLLKERDELRAEVDRLSAAPDDRERVPEGWRVEWYQPLYTKPLRPRLVPVSPSVDPEEGP